MNFKKFLSSAMALSLVASTASLSVQATDLGDILSSLDGEVSQEMVDTALEHLGDMDLVDLGLSDLADLEEVILDATADLNLDEQVFQSPDMGVGDMTPDMGVGGETEVAPEEETLLDVPEFPDVPPEFWGYNYINDAVARGFFSGYPDGNFGPGDTLTRAQFTVVMLNIRSADLVDKVDGEEWWERYYNTANLYGILPETFSTENFGEDITREEMAAMAIATLGQGNFEIPEGNTQGIEDFDAISDSYKSFVTLAYQEKLMSGKNTGFDPLGTSLRAEAAVVAMNVHNYVNQDTEGTPDTDEAPEANALSTELIALLNSVRSEDEVAGIPAFTSSDPMWDFFEPMFGFNETNTQGFAMATSAMMVQAYSVLVVKPVEGMEEEVLAGITSYQNTQIDNFTGYLESQLVYAQNPTLETLEDGTILFAMGETAQSSVDALKAALAQ